MRERVTTDQIKLARTVDLISYMQRYEPEELIRTGPHDYKTATHSSLCISDNGLNCFIILTTAPNDSVAPIHDRMPLLLSHEQVRPWLVDAGAALELLCSRPPLLLRTSCDGQLGFDDLA